jgi:hypothetical protein
MRCIITPNDSILIMIGYSILFPLLFSVPLLFRNHSPGFSQVAIFSNDISVPSHPVVTGFVRLSALLDLMMPCTPLAGGLSDAI